jgi:hypothetical protein
MFRSLLYDHSQGSSFVLSTLTLLRPVAYSVCGCMLSMCVCARCTCLCNNMHGVKVKNDNISLRSLLVQMLGYTKVYPIFFRHYR